MEIKNAIKNQVIKQVLKILPNVSDKNLIRITYIVEKIVHKDDKPTIEFVREIFKEDHPAAKLVKRFLRESNKNCINKFTTNLIINGLINYKKGMDEEAKKGNCAPLNILISPTMRCNLKCEGCYAYNYDRTKDLKFELLDRIIQEGKEMKTVFFTMLGGEPFIREDLFDLYKKHNDCYFQVYTNGTLITEEVCEKLKELGNVFPQISIEGFEKETDARRGKGTYNRLMKSMDLLKKHGIPFGFSVCVTRKNEEIVSGDEFIDLMIEKGALVGWYFLYMPVCGSPDINLMPTPKQRVHMLERDKYIRKNKSIFIVDFWNDAPAVGGCIAGKYYAHITSEGYVEPCIFTHFAVDNIKDKSLRECVNSDYFKALRKKQPYNENLLLPCQWIDNPEISREMNEKFKLIPTHKGADDILKDEKIKKSIDKYSKEVKEVYDELWEKYKKDEAAEKEKEVKEKK